jgi:hypothetical protein
MSDKTKKIRYTIYTSIHDAGNGELGAIEDCTNEKISDNIFAYVRLVCDLYVGQFAGSHSDPVGWRIRDILSDAC